jgi:hypothetical protein
MDSRQRERGQSQDWDFHQPPFIGQTLYNKPLKPSVQPDRLCGKPYLFR